jgi:Type II secretion system (T2SS), protein M
MNEQLARLREWFERLAPRERRLMGVLGIALVGFLLFLVPLAVSLTLSSRRDANKNLRDSIFTIKNSRDEIQRRQEKRDAILARYANKAPALAGLLEKAAKDNGMAIQETRDKPDVPHGKKYSERGTVVRLKKSGMLQLAKTLEQIEQQRMPIAISQLNIRRRGGEKDSYDVELGVAAYDRVETPAPAAGAGGGGQK